jgi:hypothetical protein
MGWDIADIARCVIEGRKPTTWTLHPSEDVRVWMDAIALDEDGIPLWRDDGALLLHDVGFSPRTLHI